MIITFKGWAFPSFLSPSHLKGEKQMKIVTVRKNHDCCNPECGKPIKKGEKAKTVLMKYVRADSSGFYYETYYFHLNCKVVLPGEVF